MPKLLGGRDGDALKCFTRFFFFFLSFFFFVVVVVFRAGGRIRASAAGLHHRHSTTHPSHI